MTAKAYKQTRPFEMDLGVLPSKAVRRPYLILVISTVATHTPGSGMDWAVVKSLEVCLWNFLPPLTRPSPSLFPIYHLALPSTLFLNCLLHSRPRSNRV